MPPFKIGGSLNDRDALFALANGHESSCERVDTLLAGHIASLNYIAYK